MPERRPDLPARWREISHCLDGIVYLAAAERPACGIVVAAGWSQEDAQARAQLRACALEDLHQVPPAGASDADDSRALTVADFIAGSPRASGRCVAGQGVASRARYLLPADIVRLGGRNSGVQPTVVGVVEDPSDQVGSAITDMLAFDVVTRWWGHPQIPLLRLTGQLEQIMVPGTMASARAAGLTVSAYVLPAEDFQTALVVVAGADATIGMATIGIAAGRLAACAVQTALLRALAAQAQPADDLPVRGLPVRGLPAVHGRVHHLAWRGREGDRAWLDRSALEADLTRADELAFWEGLPDWADIAGRRLGHEPIVVSAGPAARPAKVVCPGAACYRLA